MLPGAVSRGTPSSLLPRSTDAAYDWVMESLRRLPAEELVMETELFGQHMAKWRVYLQALEHAYWTRGQLVPISALTGSHPHDIAPSENTMAGVAARSRPEAAWRRWCLCGSFLVRSVSIQDQP